MRHRRGLALALLLSLAACAHRPPSDPSASRVFSFEVPAPVSSAATERFIALGDWGTGRPDQRRVARAMARWAAANPIAFVLTLGDNFYPRGVASDRDPQWRTAFEEVYDAPPLQVPFYACIGNHDRNGDVDAQVAYGRRSRRWVFPGPRYEFVRTLGDGTLVQVFVLDTTELDEAQLAWLDDALAASRARWKIVAGHHPLWSHGAHGPDDALIEALEPLLRRHDVDLYLAGHHHCLELLERHGVLHVVSGSGAGFDKAGPVEWVEGDTKYASTGGGFAAIRLARDELVIEFVRDDAVTQFAYVLRKR